MEKEWKVSPGGSELQLVSADGFVDKRIPFTDAEVLFALNEYQKQVQSLLRDLD